MFKNNRRYLFLLVIALVSVFILMFFLAKAGKENDYDRIKQKGILNIVTEYNSVDYHVSGDTIAGFQYELCKYIANRSGLEVNIILENGLDASLKGLEARLYDIVARNIPITAETKESFSFTIPIVQSKQVLVQRVSAGSTHIANQLDLANKNIYITQGSPVMLRLKNLSEEIAEPINVIEMPGCTSEQLIYKVVFGEIDYAVVDKAIAEINQKQFPSIDIGTDISFTQWQAWAVRKDSPVLLDSLNTWIEEFRGTKTI